MFERILVPLDGSPTSEGVIPYAVLLARQLGQPLALVTVVDTKDLPDAAAERAGETTSRLLEMQRAFGYDYPDRIEDEIEAQGVPASIDSMVGPVSVSILAAAASQGAGLIAMATHGRSGVDRWRLGSVADQVVRSAPVPVLLVRPGEEGAVPEAPAAVRHIVLPLDGSDVAEAALPVATFLAGAFKAPVTVLRTVSLTWFTWGAAPYDGMDGAGAAELLLIMEQEARDYVEGIARGLREAGVMAHTEVEQRPPAGAIVDVAKTPGALVVSTHGRSGLGRTLLGSVTDQVIRSAAAPVIVAHATLPPVRGETTKGEAVEAR